MSHFQTIHTEFKRLDNAFLMAALWRELKSVLWVSTFIMGLVFFLLSVGSGIDLVQAALNDDHLAQVEAGQRMQFIGMLFGGIVFLGVFLLYTQNWIENVIYEKTFKNLCVEIKKIVTDIAPDGVNARFDIYKKINLIAGEYFDADIAFLTADTEADETIMKSSEGAAIKICANVALKAYRKNIQTLTEQFNSNFSNS